MTPSCRKKTRAQLYKYSSWLITKENNKHLFFGLVGYELLLNRFEHDSSTLREFLFFSHGNKCLNDYAFHLLLLKFY